MGSEMPHASDVSALLERIADVCRAKGIDRCEVRRDGSLLVVMGPEPTPVIEERRADETDAQHAERIAKARRANRYRKLFGRPVSEAELAGLP